MLILTSDQVLVLFITIIGLEISALVVNGFFTFFMRLDLTPTFIIEILIPSLNLIILLRKVVVSFCSILHWRLLFSSSLHICLSFIFFPFGILCGLPFAFVIFHISILNSLLCSLPSLVVFRHYFKAIFALTLFINISSL